VPSRSNLEPHPHVVEIRGYDGIEAGQSLRPKSSTPAKSSTSLAFQGQGFQGLIKRHKFSRPESHGSMNVRQPGASARQTRLAFQGLKMSGQMGNVRTTARAYKWFASTPSETCSSSRWRTRGKSALVLSPSRPSQ